MSKRLSPPATAGFTLVELLVVIAIIGLVLSLTVPRLENPSRDAQLFALQFAALMNDASNTARTQEETLAVMYNSAKRMYGLSIYDPATGALTPIPDSPTLTRPVTVVLSNQYMREGSTPLPVMYFDELGRNMQVQGFGFTSLIQVLHQGESSPDASVVMERLAARTVNY